MDCFRSFSDDI